MNLLQIAQNAAQGYGFAKDLQILELGLYQKIYVSCNLQERNPSLMNTKLLINQAEEILNSVKVLQELSPKTRNTLNAIENQLYKICHENVTPKSQYQWHI